MIDGNATWEEHLARKAKRPLYYLEVAEFGLIITSFLPTEAGVATGTGWGVMLWGESAWGS